MGNDKTRDDGDRTGSPPTDRVVAILELLAGQPEPSSVASIASRLELNRSTATAILLALEHAGWVARQPDRRYGLGPGLLGVAEAVRASLPVSTRFTAVLDELVDQTGCGASLAVVGATDMTFLSVARGQSRVPAGVGAGLRLPLVAPAGAAAIAYRDTGTQQAWLASAPADQRPAFADVLTQLRDNGVAAFSLGAADTKMLDVLGEVVEMLAEHPRRGALRQRALELLIGLGGSPYTAAQFASPAALPVSYLIAPVFDDDGCTVYELQLGPLQPAVSAAQRRSYADALRTAASKLGTSKPRSEEHLDRSH